MKKFISFPKIGQFRQVIKHVVDSARYFGKDINGDAIFNPTLPVPTLTFEGTVKLHGTNAGVTINRDGEIWAQSRENVISVLQKEVYVIEFEDGTTTMVDNLDNLKIGDIIDV